MTRRALRAATAAALLALVLAVVAPGQAAADDEPVEIDLRNRRGWLPYLFVAQATFTDPEHLRGGWFTGIRRIDVDGDGITDKLGGTIDGIALTLHKRHDDDTQWQNVLPVEFTGRNPCASIDGIWDVDGDGRREIAVTARTEDRRRWLVRLIDVETGATKLDRELPGGPDAWSDGQWDGDYRVAGHVNVPTDAGERPALVVISQAGRDIEPRGVRTIDVATGEVLWTYLIGPKPNPYALEILDPDAQGRRQIVFAASGVSNMRDQSFNGTRDDKAMVFAIGDDGGLRWSRDLGAAPAGGTLTAWDFEGDGRQELLLAGYLPELGEHGVAVLDADGRTLAAIATPGPALGLYPAEGEGGGTTIYAGLRNAVLVFEAKPDELRLRAFIRASGQNSVLAVTDLVAAPGDEVLMGNHDGDLWLLNEKLELLAHARFADTSPFFERVRIVTNPDGQLAISIEGTEYRDFARLGVARNRRPFPWLLVVAAAGVIGAVVVWFLRKPPPPPTPATVRELRLQLLGRLQLSGHGAIGALSSLRRMVWHLDTILQGFAADERVTASFRELGADVLEVGLPNLEAALELARLAEMDESHVRAAEDALSRLRGHLGQATDLGDDEVRLRALKKNLHEAAASAEFAFQALRGAVERDFRADPAVACERALAAHADEIASLGVDVAQDPSPAPVCRMDEEELAFVLDNLIENAVRAMRASPRRELSLRWQCDGGYVTITVGDTGCGMPPDERDLVLTPGYSRRAGGGLGLPRSVEIMARYGGTLTVRASAPGLGTTMTVLAPQAAADT